MGDQYWNGFGMPYDPNGKKDAGTDTKGILFAFLKVVLSVNLGVVCQRILQMEALKALPLVGLLALIWSLAAVALLPIMLIHTWRTNWDRGFFGGHPVEFRHCVK